MSMILTDDEYNSQKRSLAKVEQLLKYHRQNYMAQGMSEGLTQAEAKEQSEKLTSASFTYARMCLEEVAFYEQLKADRLPESTRPSVSLALCWLRVASGLSQEQLAARLVGFTPKDVARRERNENWGLENAVQVLEALGDKAKEDFARLARVTFT